MNDCLPFAESPLTAKTRLRLRVFNNWLLIIVIFIFAAFPLAFLFGSWFYDVALIIGLLMFNSMVLDHRVIKMYCPACRKPILVNTPWTCEHCRGENCQTGDFPFISVCQHCKVEPKAYQCHHTGCDKTIFLTEEELDTPCAHKLVPRFQKPIEKVEDVKLVEHLEKKAELEWGIAEGKLQIDLNDVNNRRKLSEKKTMREEYAEESAKRTEVHELYAKELRRIETKYRHDPILLQLMKDHLEEFRERKCR